MPKQPLFYLSPLLLQRKLSLNLWREGKGVFLKHPDNTSPIANIWCVKNNHTSGILYKKCNNQKLQAVLEEQVSVLPRLLIKLCPKGTVYNCPRRTKGWQIRRFTLSLVRNFLTFKKMACEFPKSALTGFGANSFVRKFLNVCGSSESWRPNLRLWAPEELCVVTDSSDWLVTSINCILTSLVCLKTQNSVPEKETRPWCFPFIEYSPNKLLTQNSSPPLVTQTRGEKNDLKSSSQTASSLTN